MHHRWYHYLLGLHQACCAEVAEFAAEGVEDVEDGEENTEEGEGFGSYGILTYRHNERKRESWGLSENERKNGGRREQGSCGDGLKREGNVVVLSFLYFQTDRKKKEVKRKYGIASRQKRVFVGRRHRHGLSWREACSKA